jgi:hypothetical protein
MKELIRKVKCIYNEKKEKFELELYNRLRGKYEISYDTTPATTVTSPAKLKDFHILRIETLKNLPRESLNVNDRRFIEFVTMKNFEIGSVMEKSDLNTLNTIYRKHCNEKREPIELTIHKVDEPEMVQVKIDLTKEDKELPKKVLKVK